MRLPWTRVRSLALLVVFSCVSVEASATEPFYPAVTKEALAGEWAGYWRGKPLGDILLIAMEIDRNLRGTLARTSTDGYSLIYEIDHVIVESGKVTVRGHDRSRPNVQVLMEASGGVLGVDGWWMLWSPTRGTTISCFRCVSKRPPITCWPNSAASCEPCERRENRSASDRGDAVEPRVAADGACAPPLNA
jgi:hypothetical protein